MRNVETIVALATAPVESAIALIRMSGPLCPEIAESAFKRRSPTPARKACVGIYNGLDEVHIDECVYTLFGGTSSYTGEPVLEISCHGNPLIVQRILEDCLLRGCRGAEPGEFTRRAFLNGRLDLTQAEAVADTIRARSDKALSVAQRQLAGDLGRRIASWTDEVLQVLAELEAYIDFPEEDLPVADASAPPARLRNLAEAFLRVADTARYAAVLRDGVRTVIAGAPNAGKSSLLNALLGEERALVSDEPGTTRDFIRERLEVGPYCIQIVDTAGLRNLVSSDIERQGIRRTHDQVAEADFCLLVVDVSTPPPDLPAELLAKISPKRSLLVLNKADLPMNAETKQIFPDLPRILVSSKTCAGIVEFKQQLVEILERDDIVPGEESLIVGTRHAEVLQRAASHLQKSAEALVAGVATELAVSDVRLALAALGEVVGRIDNEQMLDKLFATFCIGK
ncbi:MAG: tRNA uridine-5-carboxymethylaminomethyl(34) synthesis GTPase MnmE [Puniceicoccales bacterium]|jgi:tRNA modification GTPase|nr:tRNA uridine-5-carboxymethylaminomethyl(34) synthesis GTPase MnmE [Puniceicoccales bacterium]